MFCGYLVHKGLAEIINQLCQLRSVVNLVNGCFTAPRQLSTININLLVTDVVFVHLSEDCLEC